jgi:hypothetical protein
VERDRDDDVRLQIPEPGVGVGGPEIAHHVGECLARALLHPEDEVTQ